MSTLYIGVTTFQLITILNMRTNMDTPKGDLILSERNIPNVYFIKDRIVEKNIFNKVVVLKNYDSRFSSVLKGKNSLGRFLKQAYKRHFSRSDINYFLDSEQNIDFKDYDEVYCFDKELIDVIKKFKNISINMIDEGIGAYTNYYANYFERFNKIFLYKPPLAIYYEKYKEKIHLIPALDFKKEFRYLLNDIWGYKDIIQFGENAIIFADQPFKLLPKYYSNLPSFVKRNIITKSKRYKKFLNDQRTISFFVGIIKRLRERNSNIVVKMHPRSSAEMKMYYEEEGLTVLEDTVIPWEIIFLNLRKGNVNLIAIHSTIAFGLSIYFSSTEVEHKSAFLFGMATEDCGILMSKEAVEYFEGYIVKLKRVRNVKSYEELEEFLFNNNLK